MRSTFSGLNMAMLGLNASQRALDVTGQNLSNINTRGYTRQRLDQASISPTGADYFGSRYGVKVGQGVLMTGVSQIRDPFLDIQYRNQLSKVGTSDAMNGVLSGIGEIFDNVDVSSVQGALDEVVKQLQTLSTKVGQDGNDNLVRSSFEVLLNFVHQNATSLDKVKTDLEEKMKGTQVPDLNQILSSISKLNESIKSSQVLGNPALELKDQRNALIDELSTYLPIEVVYDKVPIGSDVNVEVMKIRLKDNDDVYLVSDNKYASFEYNAADATNPKSVLLLNPVDKNGAAQTQMDVSKTFSEGVLKGNLDMLNEEGIFAGGGSDVKGIGYYTKLFDTFINTFATEMNKLNQDLGGGELFSKPADSSSFTAANIKISDKWMSGETKIIPSKNAGDPESTANENILKMKDLLSTKKLDFKAIDGAGNTITVFTGTMPGAYANIESELGVEKKSVSSILKNHLTVLSNAADARESVMGVNLDEEVMGMMRYQQSYSAAARLMTTMDQALDTLINGMGVVGR